MVLASTVAQGQSFFKRHHKYRRNYITHAIPSPRYSKPAHPYKPDQDNFGAPEESVEDNRQRTAKAMRKFERKANAPNEELANLQDKAQHDKFKDESRALGKHLSANVEHDADLTGR